MTFRKFCCEKSSNKEIKEKTEKPPAASGSQLAISITVATPWHGHAISESSEPCRPNRCVWLRATTTNNHHQEKQQQPSKSNNNHCHQRPGQQQQPQQRRLTTCKQSEWKLVKTSKSCQPYKAVNEIFQHSPRRNTL